MIRISRAISWRGSLASIPLLAACHPLYIFEGTEGSESGEEGSTASSLDPEGSSGGRESTGGDASDGSGSGGGGESTGGDTGPDPSTGTGMMAAPVCGDGTVDPGEECDDGNQLETDGCRNTCVPATCGDAIVREGHEECDDGNVDGRDGCTPGCLRERLIFVSSEDFAADALSGLHPDSFCTNLAKAAATAGMLPRAPGTAFRAWLSAPTRDMQDFVRPGNGPFLNLQGDVVALNRTRLFAGLVDFPIRYDEFGVQNGTVVWTGTRADGTLADEHCEAWTADSVTVTGRVGASMLAGSEWTHYSDPETCDFGFSIYCIEE